MIVETDTLLSITQAARLLDSHRNSVRNWIQRGHLRVIWIGNRPFLVKASVLELLRKQQEPKRKKQ
jgi:excisionase family DNA binding protein